MERIQSGKYLFGKIKCRTLVDSEHMADNKIQDRLQPTDVITREVQVSNDVLSFITLDGSSRKKTSFFFPLI
jgi:hypothetical protein